MTDKTSPISRLLRLGLGLLVLLSGLCTIFAAVVTLAEAWNEHDQARWPAAMARVDTCALDQKSTGRREGYYIHCRLSYEINGESNVANIYSATAPSREVWQYPPNQIAPYEDWVDAHPPGTRLAVRYNPDQHGKVVLAADYVPRGEPRTPGNVKQLEFWGLSFLLLLAIARSTRPRSLTEAGLPHGQRLSDSD